eukprot:maker-scaffold1966_size23764-snap-gene-0.6 protein:Tk05510 transcript:maker-scaffold1966_size23764-snap-gene-0.6-mRNA-1 annotation:"lipase maturation factor 2-like"
MVELAKTRSLFVRGVAFGYAVAFISLYPQIPGLYGRRGLLPAHRQLGSGFQNAIPWTQPGLSGLLEGLTKWNPQLLPYGSSLLGLEISETMELFCLIGATLGALMTFWSVLCNRLIFILLWLFYKSIFDVGQTFLWFQWDTLLLEMGFLAILVAPLRSHRHKITRPWDPMTLGLVRWLLFRMMFASGVVKLTSKCPAWWGLTAIPVHYESQCLPTYLAWFAYQAPAMFHKLSVIGTYVIEIPMTFLFFAPTKFLRQFTFWAQIKLMVMIMLTGNYNFFNFLFIVLCFGLMDDSWMRSEPRGRSMRSWSIISLTLNISGLGALIFLVSRYFFGPEFSPQLQFNQTEFLNFVSNASQLSIGVGLAFFGLNACQALFLALRTSRSLFDGVVRILTTNIFVLLSIFMFCLSVPTFLRGLGVSEYPYIPPKMVQLNQQLHHLHLTSSYGLFRSMTGVGGRPEVVLEGANSLQGPWQEYHFLYKPGSLNVAPKTVLPHQPRLDWQLWFAALGSYQQNPWLLSLTYRLLQNEPDVLALMNKEQNPFPKSPPKYIRAQLYHYHFTKSIHDENYWSRELQREYFPPLESAALLKALVQANILGQTEEAERSKEGLKNGVQQLLDSIRSSTARCHRRTEMNGVNNRRM